MKMFRLRRGFFPLAAAVLFGPYGCTALQQVGQSRQEFLAAGNITVQLCTRPSLDQCELIETFDISGEMVKLNRSDLPTEIGDNNLRSFMVDCGRPVGIFAYSACNFQGAVASFHCTPGQTLEVPHLGALAGKVSALVFTDEQEDGQVGTVLQHTAIDFSAAVPALHAGIDAAIASGGSPSAAVGGTPNCTAVPQCCGASSGSGGSGGMSAGDPVEETFPAATEVYWTQSINILAESGHHVSHADPCRTPPNNDQLLAIAHFTRIDLKNWGPDYDVELYWYFQPVIDSAGTLRLLPSTSRVWVEDGIHSNAIRRGFATTMTASARTIACAVLSTVAATADATVTGAGTAVLTGNQRLTFSFADPQPCNGKGRSGIACNDYRKIPPTIHLHKD